MKKPPLSEALEQISKVAPPCTDLFTRLEFDARRTTYDDVVRLAGLLPSFKNLTHVILHRIRQGFPQEAFPVLAGGLAQLPLLTVLRLGYGIEAPYAEQIAKKLQNSSNLVSIDIPKAEAPALHKICDQNRVAAGFLASCVQGGQPTSEQELQINERWPSVEWTLRFHPGTGRARTKENFEEQIKKFRHLLNDDNLYIDVLSRIGLKRAKEAGISPQVLQHFTPK